MRKSNLNGLKIAMASASLALTLVLWNLFSNKALEDALKSAGEQNQPQSSPGSSLPNLAPLPTLVPLEFNLAAQNDPAAQAVQPANAPAGVQQPAPAAAQPAQALRKVTAPVPSAAPQKPIVHQVIINVSGGGGGGGGGGSGGGGSPAPAASSGSSKH